MTAMRTDGPASPGGPVPPEEWRQSVVDGAAAQIAGQLGGRGEVLVLETVDYPAALRGRTPDLAVAVRGASRGPDGHYTWRDIEAVLDVLPTGERDAEFARRLSLHARYGIAVYVVVDPSEAACTVHSAPQDGGPYRLAERVPFGEDVHLQLAERVVVLATDGFRTADGDVGDDGDGAGGGGDPA